MPGLDGVEVCRRLKANADTKETEVILTSARMTADLETAARAAGARRALRKPIDVAAILEEVGVPSTVGR
jgi:CheY-like chemotaxis protein